MYMHMAALLSYHEDRVHLFIRRSTPSYYVHLLIRLPCFALICICDSAQPAELPR